MKIALYIEDGLEQIVLTPQTAIEKGILRKLDEPRRLEIKHGSFFRCNGGWTRHGQNDDESVMIILREAPKNAPNSSEDIQ